MENKKITKIIKTVSPTENLKNKKEKKRVAAYARVSSSSDEQRTSLETQVNYYKRLINRKENWSFAEIYYDYGISGLSCKKREGFNRMIEDALSGKIDLIITKSLSRFARNTVDTLTVLRKLTSAGVEVYFEKENINTLDSDGEFMITLLSSLAQEESRSQSRNIAWGHRKRFADGKYSFTYSQFLGYERGKDGLPVINPKEAKTVKLIYRLYLLGANFHGISEYLKDCNIPTPCGKENWDSSTVKRILTNEKYKGDALLQKTYKANLMDRRSRRNNGELPQYYVTNGHEAIIQPAVFDLLQEEIKIRKEHFTVYRSNITLNNKIVCGICGDFYMRNRTFWRCRNLYNGDKHSKNIKNKHLETSCVTAMKKLFYKRPGILENCLSLLHDINTDISENEVSAFIMENDAIFSDDWLWRTVIRRITVTMDKELLFTFSDGFEIILKDS